MTSKLESFLTAVGKDFERGLAAILPYAQTAGEVAVNLFAPSLGPLFNQVVATVVTAEQKAAALGQQEGTGPGKLADVLQIMEPVIAQALGVLNKSNQTAVVTGYINSVVTVLNAVPAPTKG